MRHRFVLFWMFLVGAQTLYGQRQLTLEEVIAVALEKNFDVRIARKTSESTELDDKYAFNAFLPRVNANGGISWTGNDQEIRLQNQDGGLVERTGPTASNNLTGAVQLDWTLFDGLRMFATRERVAKLAEQGELFVKEQMVNTIASVTTNYYDIVRQKQQLKALMEQLAVNDVRVKLAERRFDVGYAAKPELLQARVDYNATRTLALQQETLIEQLKAQLNGQLGMELPEQYDVADTIIVNLDLRREDLLQSVENTNYSLQASRKNVEIATLAVRERRAEYLPTLQFNSAYSYTRTENTKLLNPFSPFFILNNGFNYGFTVSIPVFNGFNQRRIVQQSRILQNQQEILFQQQRTQVNVALQNAFSNYENSRRILLVEEENISLAKENVAIALEVFRRGAGTVLDLRTAQQSLLEAYTRLINARYLAKVAETELLRLNGSLLGEK